MIEKSTKKIFLDDATKLGRWAVESCEKKRHIKSTWASVDHCGDFICGDVKKQKANVYEKS
tara:strand:+ start:448 stop:630 length:183 start_codon:yes stop_codon:yes gene_type:complete